LITQSEVIEVRCESCGALLSIGTNQRTERCPFCDAASVVTRVPAPDRPQPAFALGFVVERDAAARAVTDWIRRRKMAPFGLKRAAPERITGIYLPAYLYSATAKSEYQAEIGEKYRRLGVERNDDGGISLRRQEKTEYRDLEGRHVTYVADILVTASRGISNQDVETIEPFDVGRLRRYSPALVAGWSSEEPSLSPEECLRLAQAEAHAWVRDSLHAFMPGDEVRSLRHQTQFVDESLELALVPVWAFAMRYHPRKATVRVLVNGQTGRVAGTIPFSWVKLALVVGIAALAIAALIAILNLAASFQ
jgi:hypothetical protein